MANYNAMKFGWWEDDDADRRDDDEAMESALQAEDAKIDHAAMRLNELGD